MIKATATIGDRQLLMIGLSFGNLRNFLGAPGDTYIRIDGKEMNLPFDVMIFSGETEAHMAEMMKTAIGPETTVHVDPKLKP